MRPFFYLLSLFLLILACISCEKEDFTTETESHKYETEIQSHKGMVVLGPPRENPYSIDHMKEAASNLGMKSKEIKTTHLYIKYKPANEEELAELKQNEKLDFYPYPLDREIVMNGSY